MVLILAQKFWRCLCWRLISMWQYWFKAWKTRYKKECFNATFHFEMWLPVKCARVKVLIIHTISKFTFPSLDHCVPLLLLIASLCVDFSLFFHQKAFYSSKWSIFCYQRCLCEWNFYVPINTKQPFLFKCVPMKTSNIQSDRFKTCQNNRCQGSSMNPL